MDFKVILLVVLCAILASLALGSSSNQSIFWVTPTSYYNFTPLRNTTGDYVTSMHSYDNENYAIYFNFWTENIVYCDPNQKGYKTQTCQYKLYRDWYYQLSDPNTVQVLVNDDFDNVTLRYTIPPNTPCSTTEQCTVNDRSTDWVITCDPNVITVQNVECNEPSLKHYQCTFRHYSACLITAPSPANRSVYYVTPTSGYNFTSLTNETDYLTYMNENGGGYYMIYFNFWTNSISYCDQSGQGFKTQACQFIPSNSFYYQLGDPNTVQVLVNDNGNVTLRYTIPPNTPCPQPEQCINDRAIDWVITCDPNVTVVQNVYCYEPSVKYYECSFRHSSACLVNFTSPQSNNTTPSPTPTITPTLPPSNNTNTTTPSPTPIYCINNCSGNGVCHNGVCECNYPYYGLNCSLVPTLPPTSTPTSTPNNGSSEDRYFDCAMSKNGMVVSSNQIVNCSSSGITICKLDDGSIVSIPSGSSINIITTGVMDCKSDHIQCKSGYSSCSIDYPVFSIDGKQIDTIQDHPLASSASLSSVPSTITITLLIISLIQLLF